MNAIKAAIFLNSIFIILQLGGSAWAISKFITAENFSSIPAWPKYAYIIFMVIGHSFPILCIIGLSLRKNWGRILALIINVIMFTFIGFKTAQSINVITGHDFIFAPSQTKFVFSIMYLILLSYVTIMLRSKKAVDFFRT